MTNPNPPASAPSFTGFALSQPPLALPDVHVRLAFGCFSSFLSFAMPHSGAFAPSFTGFALSQPPLPLPDVHVRLAFGCFGMAQVLREHYIILWGGWCVFLCFPYAVLVFLSLGIILFPAFSYHILKMRKGVSCS